jgi:pimeloyl-ACP methyl ester carboxylesterase
VRRFLDRGTAYRIDHDIYFDIAAAAASSPWHLGQEGNLDRLTMLKLFAERGGDVLAILDDLVLASAALCGFSLGANTALRVAASHRERVAAIAAIGSGPGQVGFADVLPEEADDTWALRSEREGMAWLVAKLQRQGRAERARLIGKAEPHAMAAWWRGWYLYEPIPQMLTNLTMPALFAWGELEIQDQVLPDLPPGARLVVVRRADHVGVLERPDVILPELRMLLAAGRWTTVSS